TIINAGTGATFRLNMPIGATGNHLTTLDIVYTHDPIQLAKNIQIALNNLLANTGEGVPGTVGALPISDGNGLGNIVVTPLTPIEFGITFQNFFDNVNWPQLTVSNVVLNGGNVTVTPSTIVNGVGNSLQTVVLGGTNNNPFITAF